MKGAIMEEPVIQELEDGRIIKQENGEFQELVNEPTADFSIGDFLDGKKPNLQ